MRVAVALVLLTGVARADTPVDRPEAIEVDRDTPPPGRVELGFDGGAPVGAWALGLQLGFLDRPLRLHTVEVRTFPVRYRETLALGGAVSLGPSIVVDARIPLAHQSGDRFVGLGDARPLDAWVPGDLRIGARLRVADDRWFGVFLRGELTLPTGDDHDFAGDARWSGAWMLIGRLMLPHDIVIAATGGIRLRGAEVRIADQLVGDEVVGGLGMTYGLPPVPGLWCEPEQLRLSAEVDAVLGDHVANQHGPSPVEGRLGVIGTPRPDLTIGVHVGTHLDDQIGAPTFRAMLELAYRGAPPPPPSRPTTVEDVDDTE